MRHWLQLILKDHQAVIRTFRRKDYVTYYSKRFSIESRKRRSPGAAIRKVRAQDSPNDRINVAVIGFHSRGMSHIRGYAQLPNVRVAALCDVDERLFPPAVAEVERLSGHRPVTEHDMRRLLERKDIDAVSIATPD